MRFHDLEFDGAYVERRTLRGFPFPHWEPIGMPKIPNKHLDNAFYLFPTVEAAKEGMAAGGTGFAVTIDSEVMPGMGYNYAVTNYHVAIGVEGRGNPVIRLNTRDGGHDIIDLDVSDWEFDPVVGSDIAVTRMRTNEKLHACPVAPVDSFVTAEWLAQEDIGPGDGVFMVGRFVDHDGGLTNRPAARFGHISIMPAPLKQYSGNYVEAFCADMNSRTGYSGSPVWLYRTPGRNLQEHDFSESKLLWTGGTFLKLLGIHYGQFPEFWKIEDGVVVPIESGDSDEPAMGTQKQIRGMSGMTCVLPAWRILEVLNRPKFKKQREESERYLAEQKRKSGRSDPASESAA